jgi:hypothetical protein
MCEPWIFSVLEYAPQAACACNADDTYMPGDFENGSPADGIAAAPETSARPAGGFQGSYTDLLRP